MLDKIPIRIDDCEKQLAFWRKWVESLWQKALNPWLRRNGQDNFYRTNVIIPALINKITSLKVDRGIILDIGAGDGKCTSAVYDALRKKGFKMEGIHLIDKSVRQLKAAAEIESLRCANTHALNISNKNWSTSLRKLPSQKTILCIFVIQELPEIVNFAGGLRQIMRPDDFAFIVTVAPSFSYMLKRRGLICCVDNRYYPRERDWKWAGEYPIDGKAGKFYLPHFQRTTLEISSRFRNAGLYVGSIDFLKAAKTRESKIIFGSAIYGRDMLLKPSSILLTCRPKKLAGEYLSENRGEEDAHVPKQAFC